MINLYTYLNVKTAMDNLEEILINSASYKSYCDGVCKGISLNYHEVVRVSKQTGLPINIIFNNLLNSFKYNNMIGQNYNYYND